MPFYLQRRRIVILHTRSGQWPRLRASDSELTDQFSWPTHSVFQGSLSCANGRLFPGTAATAVQSRTVGVRSAACDFCNSLKVNLKNKKKLNHKLSYGNISESRSGWDFSNHLCTRRVRLKALPGGRDLFLEPITQSSELCQYTCWNCCRNQTGAAAGTLSRWRFLPKLTINHNITIKAWKASWRKYF